MRGTHAAIRRAKTEQTSGIDNATPTRYLHRAMRHEYLTRADFPTWTPKFGRDEETGENHGTEAEFNSDCDRLAEQVQTLVPGSCASWSIEDDGVTYLVYWDPTPGVAEDYSDRETDDPEVEAVFRFDTIRDTIESLKQMQENTTRERVEFLAFMSD